MNSSITQIAVGALRSLKRRIIKRKSDHNKRLIERILRNSGPPCTRRSEAEFLNLQGAYSDRPEYGYDHRSLWTRAFQRAIDLVALPGLEHPGSSVLEVGAGDGVLGSALRAYGHRPMLLDQNDWRSEPARDISFTIGNCCEALSFETGSFDCVCSFNSMEHFPDPLRALQEMVRVVKPGGWIYIDFNPLFSSPWGLHAYRFFKMPYPQFLFSDQFIKNKLSNQDIWDLGVKRDSLQYVNGWKLGQYRRILNGSGLEIRQLVEIVDDSHVGIVRRFPESFAGRGLSYEDLAVSGMRFVGRKTDRSQQSF